MLASRGSRIGLLFAVAAALAVSVRADPRPAKRGGLNASDEAFLVQARESIGELAPQWGDAPDGNGAGFQQALRSAATHPPVAQPIVAQSTIDQTTGQRSPPASYASGWPQANPQAAWGNPPQDLVPSVTPRWRTLLDASTELERIANSLERQEFWDQAEPVRTAAAGLRKRARSLAEGHSSSQGGQSE